MICVYLLSYFGNHNYDVLSENFVRIIIYS